MNPDTGARTPKTHEIAQPQNVCPHIYSIDTVDEAGNRASAVQFAVETVFGEMGYHCMM